MVGKDLTKNFQTLDPSSQKNSICKMRKLRILYSLSFLMRSDMLQARNLSQDWSLLLFWRNLMRTSISKSNLLQIAKRDSRCRNLQNLATQLVLELKLRQFQFKTSKNVRKLLSLEMLVKKSYFHSCQIWTSEIVKTKKWHLTKPWKLIRYILHTSQLKQSGRATTRLHFL